MLTDRQCRAANPQAKEYKLGDQHGLYLLVRPSGYKAWKMKYRLRGREGKLTFGPYPEVTLAQAREAMFAARHQLRAGIDPAHEPALVEEITFEHAARKWLSLQCEGWKPKHHATVMGRIEDDLLPKLGSKKLTQLKARDFVRLLEAVQDRGAIEVAHRLRQYANAIFDCAIALDWCETNPAASITAALKPKRSRPRPAIVKLRPLRAFLMASEAEPCQPATKLASRLLALTAVRPGALIMAQREEFEGLTTSEPIWRIPADKMKLELAESEQEAFEFLVPLSRQAVDTVNVAIEFSGRRKYLFASTRHSHRPISESALSSNYRRVPKFGGRHVPHGWRSSFSTIMNERAADLDRPGDRQIIDLMLAHRQPGVEPLYNRAAYMGRRREIAQEWADLLTEGLAGPDTLIEGLRKRQPTR